MVCKSDIVSCFKELNSYDRIRVMCNLLHLCLPSELRYFGTCLEYLGKRDFHELRQLENVANSPAEINSPELMCLTEKAVRTKLVLYLSLLHSNNDACSNGLFKILSNWSEVDNCLKTNPILNADDEVLEELLMLYTLAVNHPAFTCEQKLALENIYSKVHAEKQRLIEINKPILEPPPTLQNSQFDSHHPQMCPTANPIPEAYPLISSTSQCPYPIPPVARPTQNDIPDVAPPNNYLRLVYPAGPGPAPPMMPPPWPPHSIVLPPSEPRPSPTSSPCQSNTPSRPSSPGRNNNPLPVNAAPQLPPHFPLPAPPVPPPIDLLRDSLMKEMPNYSSNLQGYNIHQLRGMGDEELGELGLPQNAMHQLRTIVNRLQATNGINSMVDMSCLVKPPDPTIIKPDNGAPCHTCLTMGSRPHVDCTDQMRHIRVMNQMDQRALENEPNVASSSDSDTNSPPNTPETSGQIVKEIPPCAESWNVSGLEDRISAVDLNNGAEERKTINPPPPINTGNSGRSRGIMRGRSNLGNLGMQSLPRGRNLNPSHRKRGENILLVNGGAVPDESQRKVFTNESQFPFSAPSPAGYMPSTPFLRSYPTFPPNFPTYRFQHNNELVYQYPPPPSHFIPGPIPYPTMIPPLKPSSCYNCGSQSHCGQECPESTMEDVAKLGQYRIDYSRFGECPPASDK